MECTQKQQVIPSLELSQPTEVRRINKSKQIDAYDKKSAEYRRYLASEAGIRELERRRSLNMATVHRMSFIH